ncbi:ABC transporter ATP-binding protein [Nocardia carnea]|uniref:ABC transporter ATP-binding protein n=1 Tax=Nocardia carnea TaxID=37328 RepID=UPI002455DAC2|nr:ABC transporter ATP-binding protein [Nocardia carnea]
MFSTRESSVAERSEASSTAAIELRNLTQAYATKNGVRTAVQDVNLSIEDGEFVTIVGPSGCGKSTILYMIAGLRPPHSGEVQVLGTPVDARQGPHPDVGFVFQRDALLPWRTAVQNVALGLRYRGTPKKEANDEARGWLSRVGLEGSENSYPHQLSGGMRKRVAIAASLVLRPRVLLMDEPFSALDAQTRNLMENDLLALWEETRQTVVFVTHDLEEAVGLADRVVTMTRGPGTVLTDRTVPIDRPRNLLELRFDSAFTAIHSQLWDDLREQVVLPRTGGRS